MRAKRETKASHLVHTKEQCRQIAKMIHDEHCRYPDEFVYGGIWDNHHHFQHRTRGTMTHIDLEGNKSQVPGNYRYADIAATDEDLENGNLKFYFEHGFTRMVEPTDLDD